MNPSTRPATSSKTTYQPRLSEDQRHQVKILFDSGKTRGEIKKMLNISQNQIRYALRERDDSPKKPQGRPRKLSEGQIDQLENFVRASRENRQMSFLELAVGPFAPWGVSENLIRRALKDRGYTRYVALSMSRLPLETEKKRKEWTEAPRDSALLDPNVIFWTDGTWTVEPRFDVPRIDIPQIETLTFDFPGFHEARAPGVRFTNAYITRKPDEKYESTCIVDRD